MSWLPKSRKARVRLLILAVVAPVLALAVGLSLFAMRQQVSFFYTPAQAIAAKAPPGRRIQLGGLVQRGSVVKYPDGRVDFVVSDLKASMPVSYRGDLPDLFREGQGIVADGTLDPSGRFHANQVLAKHDETYMPRELSKALKDQGEWRGAGTEPSANYGQPTAQGPAT